MVTDRPNVETLPRRWIWRVVIPTGLFCITLVTGTVGTYQYLVAIDPQGGDLRLWYEAFLTTIGFFVFNGFPAADSTATIPMLVYIARSTGALFAAYTAVVALGILFAHRLKPYTISWWHLRNRLLSATDQGHIVICGFGEKGRSIAKTHLDNGNNVVVIDEDPRVADARHVKRAGGIVFHSDPTRRQTLCDEAKIALACEIYVTYEDDRTASQIVDEIATCVDTDVNWQRTEPLTCHAHVSSRHQRHFLHQQLESVSGLILQTYSRHEATARELLQQYPVDRFEPGSDGGRVHVVLIGWSELTRAVIHELLETMHYPEGYDRLITVACREPETAREEFLGRYPCLCEETWDDGNVYEFVDELFPLVQFVELPTADSALHPEWLELFKSCTTDDVLTVIVGENDGFRSGGWVSTLLPRLNHIERELELQTQVLYHTDLLDDDSSPATAREFDFSSEEVQLTGFCDFVQGCSPARVRGDQRNQLAKQFALLYHLQYEWHDEDTWSVPLPDRTSIERVNGYERAISVISELSDTELTEAVEAVWQRLPEHHRDSNRYAADHALVKRRFAEQLTHDTDRNVDETADQTEAIVANDDLRETLANVEHHRWCAEKFLDGWRPVPTTLKEQWMDDEAQHQLREQKYHFDLRPLAELRQMNKDESGKDRTQVEYVLTNIQTKESITDAN